MKLWLNIAAIFLLAGTLQADRPWPPQPEFQEGVTYHYKITGNLSNGVEPVYNASNSEFVTYATVASRVKEGVKVMELQLHNGTLKLNSPIEREVPLDDVIDQLSLPVQCRYIAGVPEDCMTVEEDPNWSINFKKYILTQMVLKTVSLLPVRDSFHEPPKGQREGAYEVYEDGVGGLCMTRYYWSKEYEVVIPESGQTVMQQNVTKIRHHENCVSRVHYQHDNLYDRYTGNRTGLWQGERGAPEEAFTETHVVIRKEGDLHPVIKHVDTTSKNVLHSHGKQLAFWANSTLTLWANTWDEGGTDAKFVRPIETLQPVYITDDEDANTEKGFFELFRTALYDPETIVQSVYEDIMSLTSKLWQHDLSETSNTGNLTLKIIDGVASLSMKQLEELHQRLSFESSAISELATKIYEQILPLTGSRHAVLFIEQLVRNQRIHGLHAVRVVSAVAENLYNSTKMVVETYKELCFDLAREGPERLFSAACLTYAKLFRRHFNMTSIGVTSRRRSGSRNLNIYHSSAYEKWRMIKKQLAKTQAGNRDEKLFAAQLLQEVKDNLELAPTFHHRVTYLHVLGQMGLEEVLPALIPYMTGKVCVKQHIVERECNILRRTAINTLYALNFNDSTEVYQLLYRIYKNTTEPERLRIMVVGPMLHVATPTPALLDKLVSSLAHEPSEEVKNFVLSTFKDIAKSEWPETQTMAEYSRRALGRLSNTTTSMLNSFSIVSDFYDDVKETGARLKAKALRNETLGYPAAKYFELNTKEGQQTVSLLRYALDTEGMDELVFRLSAAIQNLRLKFGSTWLGKLHKLDIDAIMAEVGDIRVSMLNEVFKNHDLNTMENEEISKILNLGKLICRGPKSKTLRDGITVHGRIVQVYLPISFQKVVPSEISKPVLMQHRSPLILSLEYTLTKKSKDDSCFFIAKLHPKLLFSSVTSTRILHQGIESFTSVVNENTIHVSLPFEVSAGFTPEGKILSSFKPLSLGKPIIIHRQETRSVLAGPSFKDATPVAFLVKGLQQPVQLNGTYTVLSNLVGFNISYSSLGENINADRPVWRSEKAVKHGIIYALQDALFSPEHLNNEFNITWDEDLITGSRGYNMSTVYWPNCREVQSTPEDIPEELLRLYKEDGLLDNEPERVIPNMCEWYMNTNTTTEASRPTHFQTVIGWAYSIDYRVQNLVVRTVSDVNWEELYPAEAYIYFNLPNITETEGKGYFFTHLTRNNGQRYLTSTNKMSLVFREYPQPNTLRCRQAVTSGKFDLTSCWLSFMVESDIPSLSSNITYKNLPEEVVNASMRYDMALKMKLYPQKLQIYDEKGMPNTIVVDGTLIEIIPKVYALNVVIQKPSELLVIKDRLDDRPQPAFRERMNALTNVEEPDV